MKQKIYLQIINKQKIAGGEDDILNSENEGVLYKKRGQYYLVYEDYSEGLEGARTSIKIDPSEERILLNRNHPAELKQIFKVGETTRGYYRIRSEKMELEIETNNIEYHLNEQSGNIKIEYKIYFGGKLATDNNLEINYTKKGVE